MESVIGCGVSDSIIVFTLKDGPFRFRALSLKSGHYVDFLRIGRGPDEISTGLLSRIRKIGDNPVVDIDAPNERVIITVDLKETLRKGTAAIIKKTQTPVHAMKSFIIGENILSEVVFDEDIYSLKTFDGATLELLRKEQIYGQEEYLTSLQPLFGSVIKVNPNESRVSMGMICFDEINIYDISGENHKSITTSNSSSSYSTIKRLISTGVLPPERYYYNQDVTTSNIYALYLNGQSSEETTPVTIQVFTWDGELINLYRINEPIRSIAVDSNGSSLYGLTREEKLYKYELK